MHSFFIVNGISFIVVMSLTLTTCLSLYGIAISLASSHFDVLHSDMSGEVGHIPMGGAVALCVSAAVTAVCKHFWQTVLSFWKC